jgi:hypothetical protein
MASRIHKIMMVKCWRNAQKSPMIYSTQAIPEIEILRRAIVSFAFRYVQPTHTPDVLSMTIPGSIVGAAPVIETIEIV